MSLKGQEWFYRAINVIGILIVLIQAYRASLVLNFIGAALVLIGFVGVWRVLVKQKRPRQLTPIQSALLSAK